MITGYRAEVDPALVARDYEALVWVTLTEINRASMERFEDEVQGIEDVTEAYRMIGQPDYLLRVAVADRDALERLYIDRLAALPFVKGLTTQLMMKTIKRTGVLPV